MDGWMDGMKKRCFCAGAWEMRVSKGEWGMGGWEGIVKGRVDSSLVVYGSLNRSRLID